MGFIDFLLGTAQEKTEIKAAAKAGVQIPYYQDSWSPLAMIRVSRSDAMQVPAVARARNIIAGTIATLGFESISTTLYSRNNQSRSSLTR